jgi:C4-dicarboxylate-specific signal transduction histidine kinase
MPGSDALAFFGGVCAAVSHELKNVLAVINEQAGLLGDLSCMAARGMPLDPDRLAAVAACLQKQVCRGDAILTDVSRFAHTADPAPRPLPLGEAACLAVSLCQRRAAMRQVALTATPGCAALAPGDAFALVRLVALCLERAMDAPDAAKAVAVATADAPDGPTLTVSGMAADAILADDDPLRALAAAQGARLDVVPGGLTLTW